MSRRNRHINFEGTSKPKPAKIKNEASYGVPRDYKATVADLNFNVNTKIYIFGPGGVYGNLPNTLINTVDDSGTASTCIKRLRDFTFGDGFKDENTAKFRINPEQTANQVLSEISNYISYFETAFVLRILFDNSGKVSHVYHEQLEAFRKREDGLFVYNRYMGTKIYKKADDILIPTYDPMKTPEQRFQQITHQMTEHGKQVGEVLYVMSKGAGFLKDKYPIPSYYSGLDDIESDAAISRLEKRNIVKGWKAKVIVSMGKVDNETEDEDGHTALDYVQQTLKSFSNPDGSDIALLLGETAEDRPQISTLDVKDILDGVDKATERVGRKVCRHFGVPPVIVGFEEPTVIGNSQALANALALFKRDIQYKQQVISDIFTGLFPMMNWEINNIDMFSYIAPEVLASLTIDELRKLGGYNDLPQVTSASTDATINAINSLSPLVANKVLESLSEDEIRALIGLGTKGEPSKLDPLTPHPNA